MKRFLFFVLFFSSFLMVSQEIDRINISGKVIVEGGDIEGITIFNASSNEGAVTNAYGEFIIEVALDDLLQIRALAYQDIDVRVNEAIIESRKMSVYLIEEMIMLDEVSVPDRELTGNIVTDARNVEADNPVTDAFYFGYSSEELGSMGDDNLSQIDHLERNEQGKYMVHGLNIINIVDQLLIPLFRSEVKDKKAAGVPEVPAESIKYYLGSDFITENFGIPEHRVEEFIRYVEDDDFDYDLLNYGRELELLDLLSKKSKTFLRSNGRLE